MNFTKIIQKYERLSLSNKDMGNKFERLIQAYLKTDNLYRNRFEQVWLWEEFPYKNEFGGQDIGIDLVAKESSNNLPPPPIFGLSNVNFIQSTFVFLREILIHSYRLLRNLLVKDIGFPIV